MATIRITLLSSLALAFLIGSGRPANAEPFAVGDVLRVTFNLQGFGEHYPGVALDTLDAFEFALGVSQPISYTTKLFDRGQLLGIYTGVQPGAGSVTSRFVAPTSIYTVGNPTVIDFSSFHDGTFDGALEFTIQSGRMASIHQVSDDVTLGYSVSPSLLFSYAVVPTTYEIAPVPEPASIILLSTGLAAAALRRHRRRTPTNV